MTLQIDFIVIKDCPAISTSSDSDSSLKEHIVIKYVDGEPAGVSCPHFRPEYMAGMEEKVLGICVHRQAQNKEDKDGFMSPCLYVYEPL